MEINRDLIRIIAGLLIVSTFLNAEAYNRLGDVVFDDDEVVSVSASSPVYLLPNEPCPSYFIKAMPASRDTLLSVGTFRALVTFAQGAFHRLLAVDYEQEAVLFNRRHLDLIRAIADLYPHQLSHQRYQYQAAILGVWLTEEGLSEVDAMENESSKTQLLSESSFYKRHPQKMKQKRGSRSEPKAYKFLEFLGNFAEAAPEHLLALKQDERASQSWDIVQESTIFTELFIKDDMPYYWESDEQWQHLSDALRDDRILVIKANLRNPADFERLNLGLEALGAKISAIDISNVAGSGSFEKNLPMAETIASLPKADDAKLWLTSISRVDPDDLEFDNKSFLAYCSHLKRWRYYSFDANDPGIVLRAMGR